MVHVRVHIEPVQALRVFLIRDIHSICLPYNGTYNGTAIAMLVVIVSKKLKLTKSN
jgi:hypothetical protein